MIIYKTTNLINNKIYVGYDTKNNPDYFGSGKYYRRAEKKHGKENFRKAVIDSSDDFDELCAKEIFWINFYDARNPIIGYNIAPGGEGVKGTRSEETRRRMSASQMGNKGARGRKGTHHSEESKKKISASNTGKIKSDEHKKKLSNALKGRIPWNKFLKAA